MSALSYDIKLIVGLGNPGPKYSETRHNAGFWFVEDLASQYRGRFIWPLISKLSVAIVLSLMATSFLMGLLG